MPDAVVKLTHLVLGGFLTMLPEQFVEAFSSLSALVAVDSLCRYLLVVGSLTESELLLFVANSSTVVLANSLLPFFCFFCGAGAVTPNFETTFTGFSFFIAKQFIIFVLTVKYSSMTKSVNITKVRPAARPKS